MNTTDEQIAAVLHDVIEDTGWTVDQLRQEGFSETVLQAVDALTRREGEDYFAYVRRAGADPVARSVKLADLADNMDLSRQPAPTDRHRARLERYKAAVTLLHSEGSSQRLDEGMEKNEG